MDHSQSSPGRLPPAWGAAVRAHQIPTGTVPTQPSETNDRQSTADSVDYLHSSELRALIAWLKCGRIRRGLSLGDVARSTERSRSSISRLESGQFPNPTFDTVFRYASALGCHITLRAEPEPSPSPT